MTSSLAWFELAEFDDFLSASLIDPLFYWSEIRKAYKHTNLPPEEILSTDETLRLIRNYLIFPVGKVSTLPPAKRLNYLMEEFMGLGKVRNFLRRYPYKVMIKEFIRHAKRYFSIYQKDCGFDICATDRYIKRSNKLEACVIAKKVYNENDEIKYLYGCLSELSEEELDSLDSNDFSVINISSRGNSCLMLGPTRFINHDCNGNAKFWSTRSGMTIRATRKILIGEEITVPYSPDYFGKRNKDCMCATCERDLLGSYSLNQEADLSKETIIVPLEDEYSEPEVIVIGSSDETGSKNQSDNEDPSLKDAKETETSTSTSDSPIVLDPDLDLAKVDMIKRKRKMTPMGIDEDNFNKPRKLRPRRKKKSNSSSLSTIKSFPYDSSPDSLRNLIIELYGLGSKKLKCKELKQRRILRTFQRLYNTRYYDKDYQISHAIYDCYNCGCYFDFNQKEFNSMNYEITFPEVLEDYPLNKSARIDYLYCCKCLRHYQVYKLAWPFTEPQIANKNDFEVLRQFLTFFPDNRPKLELIKTPRYPYLQDKNVDSNFENVGIIDKSARDKKRFNYYDLNNYIVSQSSYNSESKDAAYMKCISYTIPEIEQIFDDMKDMSFCGRQHTANDMKSKENIDIPLRTLKFSNNILDKLVQEWIRIFEVYLELVTINQMNASHSKESSVDNSKSNMPVYLRMRSMHLASESSMQTKKSKNKDLRENSKKFNETTVFKTNMKKLDSISKEDIDMKDEIAKRKNQNNSMQLSMLDLLEQRKKWQMNTHFMHEGKNSLWNYRQPNNKSDGTIKILSLSHKRQSSDRISPSPHQYQTNANHLLTADSFPSKGEMASKITDMESLSDAEISSDQQACTEPKFHHVDNRHGLRKFRIPSLEDDDSDSSSGSDVEILGVIPLIQDESYDGNPQTNNEMEIQSYSETSMNLANIISAKVPVTTGIHSIDDSYSSSSDDDIVFYDNYPSTTTYS